MKKLGISIGLIMFGGTVVFVIYSRISTEFLYIAKQTVHKTNAIYSANLLDKSQIYALNYDNNVKAVPTTSNKTHKVEITTKAKQTKSSFIPTQKFFTYLTPSKTENLENQGFNIKVLSLNKKLQNNKIYIIDTKDVKYDQYVLKFKASKENKDLAVNTAVFKNRVENKSTVLKNLTKYDLLPANLPEQHLYVSPIIYKQGRYIVVQTNSDIEIVHIELWHYIKTHDNLAKTANTASVNTQVLTTNLVAVSDLNTSYNLDSSSGAKFSKFNIIPRSVWGANPSYWDYIKPNLNINDFKRLKYIPEDDCRWLPEYYRVSRFIIHHTVTKNYPDDPYREIRELYLYHAYSRGWGDVGYNFIIDSSGRVFEGKIGGIGVKGYHAFEAGNDMSIGIALIGNFTYVNPSAAQLDALKKLLAEQAQLFGLTLHYCGGGTLREWLNTNCTVFGHRHIYVWDWDKNDWYKRPTACPGQEFVASGTLANIVSQAETYRQEYFVDIKDARNWAIDQVNQIYGSNPQDIYYIKLKFKNLDNYTRKQISSFVPQYSGIWSYNVGPDKTVYINIKSDYSNKSCGYIVPPIDWNGFDSCGTHGCMFFPGSKGAYDRLIPLLTVLKLNPRVQSVSLTKNTMGFIDRVEIGNN